VCYISQSLLSITSSANTRFGDCCRRYFTSELDASRDSVNLCLWHKRS